MASVFLPGLGQAFQRRWAGAVGYGGIFIAATAWFFITAMKILLVYYSMIKPDYTPPEHLPLIEMLVSFALALLVYTAGVFDTYRAERKNSTKMRSVAGYSK